MEFKDFDLKERDRWDKFCLANDMAWFWHTSFRLDHALTCSGLPKVENKSFYVEENGEMIAIAPLTIDTVHAMTGGDFLEMIYGGIRVPAPVVKDGIKDERRERILKDIFKKIDAIAITGGVGRIAMRMPMTLSYLKKHPYNYNMLLKYGYQDTSLNTSIVDLTRSEDDLWKGVSENHQRAITKGSKALAIRIIDNKNFKTTDADSFRSFYLKIAKKASMPEGRFRLLSTYLENGMAVMAEASHERSVVGYVVVIKYKADAYYFMGANEEDFGPTPIAHVMHWEIMKYLKDSGVAHYEVGIQQFGPLVYDIPSEKDISISWFKRGFGGVVIPQFAGEKFYSKEYCKKIWESRIQKYLEHVTS